VESLCERILNTRPTVKLFREMLESKPAKQEEIAFRFYFLNRTSFSGLWRGGPIGGYAQRSRWKVDREWRAEKSVWPFPQISSPEILTKTRSLERKVGEATPTGTDLQ